MHYKHSINHVLFSVSTTGKCQLNKMNNNYHWFRLSITLITDAAFSSLSCDCKILTAVTRRVCGSLPCRCARARVPLSLPGRRAKGSQETRPCETTLSEGGGSRWPRRSPRAHSLSVAARARNPPAILSGRSCVNDNVI